MITTIVPFLIQGNHFRSKIIDKMRISSQNLWLRIFFKLFYTSCLRQHFGALGKSCQKILFFIQ